ncbi:hypothetical protein B0T24DRAFT_110434 [Lasiosphaeria ovina]|uniref:Uncharacterized protein n=1 Tax=Lasiosphaeria ovina TaxID=92902 RepID=A0AAE0MYE5_9PEZI|nr:hypothetical protein B0T24DRAFT_110434 [Lasiosphaeria ovina]
MSKPNCSSLSILFTAQLQYLRTQEVALPATTKQHLAHPTIHFPPQTRNHFFVISKATPHASDVRTASKMCEQWYITYEECENDPDCGRGQESFTRHCGANPNPCKPLLQRQATSPGPCMWHNMVRTKGTDNVYEVWNVHYEECAGLSCANETFNLDCHVDDGGRKVTLQRQVTSDGLCVWHNKASRYTS